MLDGWLAEHRDRQPPPTREEFDMLLNPRGEGQDFFGDYSREIV